MPRYTQSTRIRKRYGRGFISPAYTETWLISVFIDRFEGYKVSARNAA